MIHLVDCAVDKLLCSISTCIESNSVATLYTSA